MQFPPAISNAFDAIHPTMVDNIKITPDGGLHITNDDYSERHLGNASLSAIKLTSDTISASTDGSTTATHVDRRYNRDNGGIQDMKLLAGQLQIVTDNGATKTPPAGNYDSVSLTTTGGKTQTFIADPYGHG